MKIVDRKCVATFEQFVKKLNDEIRSSNIETAKSRLDAIYAICKGGKEAGIIGESSQRQRFHWLTSPKSTVIQTSSVHSSYCKDPAETLEHLFDTMVKTASIQREKLP